MNYKDVYDRIVEKALSEKRKKGQGVYYERHHIVPRFMGGKNNKENYVLLTAKEHFICHYLLTKIVPLELRPAAWNSVYKMGVKSKNQERWISSRIYEKAKEEFIKDHIDRHTGAKRSKKTRDSQKLASKKRWEEEKKNGIKRNYANSKGPKGHSQTEDHKNKRAKKLNKAIMVYGVIYSSRKEALEKAGLSYQEMRIALYGDNQEVYYL